MAELGILLDARSVHPGLSARNNLLALARTAGIGRRRVDEVIELAGLGEVAGTRAGGFSLGMGQRLGVAAALLGQPQRWSRPWPHSIASVSCKLTDNYAHQQRPRFRQIQALIRLPGRGAAGHRSPVRHDVARSFNNYACAQIGRHGGQAAARTGSRS
jgi:hypothetical protein